jgi:hypothetical protein
MILNGRFVLTIAPNLEKQHCKIFTFSNCKSDKRVNGDAQTSAEGAYVTQ